jgi:hypothetical protein
MFRAFTTDIAIKYYATNQSNSQNAEALGVELRGFEPLTLACHRGIPTTAPTTNPRVAGHCTRAEGWRVVVRVAS